MKGNSNMTGWIRKCREWAQLQKGIPFIADRFAEITVIDLPLGGARLSVCPVEFTSPSPQMTSVRGKNFSANQVSWVVDPLGL